MYAVTHTTRKRPMRAEVLAYVQQWQMRFLPYFSPSLSLSLSRARSFQSVAPPLSVPLPSIPSLSVCLSLRHTKTFQSIPTHVRA